MHALDAPTPNSESGLENFQLNSNSSSADATREGKLGLPHEKRSTMDAFCLRLPKIELHAHLTGSIRVQTLHEIWQRKTAANSELEVGDPLKVMPPGKHDYNLETFFPLFSSYIYKLITTRQDIRESTLAVLTDFEADGTIYLELRTTPRRRGMTGTPGEEVFTKTTYIRTIHETIRVYEADPSHKMKTKLIISVDRRDDIDEVMDEVMSIAAVFSNRSSGGVVGLDLCGDPSRVPIDHLAPAFERAKELGLKVTLHFAEALQSSTIEELCTLLSWKPDRIGHVIHVPDEIKQQIIEQDIGVELCLSCNVHAKMLTGGGGYADHHFGWWKDNHIGIALCTDDVGVFGSPISAEYRLAAEHFNLSQDDLLKLARGVAEITFADEVTKAELRRIYDEFRI